MLSKKNSYPLEELTQEKTPNPGHYNAGDISNNIITCGRDVQVQVKSSMFKPFLGFLYMFLHAFFNQLDSVIIKLISYIGLFQLSLLRHLGIFVGILPIVVYRTDPVFGERKYRFRLFVRGFCDATGFLFNIIAYSYLPLAEACIILSMTPIVTSLVARVVLKERFGVAQITSLVMTVCGVLSVLRIPELLRNKKDIHFDSTYIAGLVAALATVSFYSWGNVYIRKLKNVHYSTVVLYACTIGLIESSLLNGIFISYIPSECGWNQILCILFGVFSLVSSNFFTMGVQEQTAGLASVEKASFDILIIIVFQAIFFNVYPDLYVICGACIVIVSVLILGIKNWILLMPDNSNVKRKLKFLL